MTEKQFMNGLANSQVDIVQQFLDLLNGMHIVYCVIGGLAVNAYVEPVVSLDLDMVIAAEAIDKLSSAAEKLFTINRFPHSLNLKNPQSDLRIQLQTDPRYQAFIRRAVTKKVMGYEMNVATLEDVLQGKIWAYLDDQRRKSKRQKDLADIFRLVETYPHLVEIPPPSHPKPLQEIECPNPYPTRSLFRTRPSRNPAPPRGTTPQMDTTAMRGCSGTTSA